MWRRKEFPNYGEEVTVIAINDRLGEIREFQTVYLKELPLKRGYWLNPGVDYWYEWEILAWRSIGE